MNAQGWIDAYARAWRDKDADGAAALFTPDAIYRSHPLREPHAGRQGIHDYWRSATDTQEELDLRFGKPIVEADRAAVEFWAQMRNDGEEVTLPGILYLRFAPGGLCQELRETWHVEPGRHAPPPGWGL
jgi:hypothetical protein